LTAARETSSTPRRGALGPRRAGVFPPGPRGLPLLGVAVTFQYDPLNRMAQWVRRFGDVVHYRVAGTHFYVLAHPDDIAQVLVGEHQRTMKDEITHALASFVGRGLLTSEGSYWRRQRRIIAPTFQRRHIERFADAMVNRTRVRLGGIEPGVRDVHRDFMELTLAIVLDTLFGAAEVPDLGAVGRIVHTMMDDFQVNFLTWRRLLPQWMNPEPYARMEGAKAELDAILYRIIGERRASGEERDDLLGRLLAASDDDAASGSDGSRMSDAQLRDEVATLFLAGHETTALTLSYAVWLLARAPEAARRLEDEVDRVLGGRPARLADVAALAWTDAVVRESMRLYPPAYIIGREALDDCEIAGWVIPRGAQVLLPQWIVHRDPRWFDDPETFAPERWLGGLAERLPKLAYFPFGGGPRVCVGNHFAQLEAVLVLATVAQRLRFAPDPTHALELSPSVTLRPKTGARVQVERRPGAW
jgi:cytochrome P450